MGADNPQLAVDFKVNLAEFDKGIDQATKKIAAGEKAVAKAGGAVTGGLTSAVGGATLILGKLAGAVAGIGFTAFALRATEAAAGLERNARAASMSYDAYTKLAIGFQVAGVGADAAKSGLENFSRVSALARLKTGELYETLKFIAPALADQLTKTKTTEEALTVYAEAIRRMQGESNKAALAVKGFGDAGIDLLPMLSKGAAGVAEMQKRSEGFITVAEDSAKAAKNVKTEFGLLADSMSNDAANKLKPVNGIMAEFAILLRGRAEKEGGYFEAARKGYDEIDAKLKSINSQTAQYAQLVGTLQPLKLLPDVAPKKPGEWKTTTTAGPNANDPLFAQQKPNYAGTDAVQQSIAGLAAARGEQAKAIQLEGAQQIEQARRLLAERTLDEKQFASIRVNTNAATEAKLVALRRDTQSQLRDLSIAALTAEENGLGALSLEYERDTEKYQVMLQQKLISEKQFAAARESINRVANVRIGEEISKLGDKVREQTQGFATAIEGALGNALTNTFTSGKDAARAFLLELAQGLQRATMQALILKPLMEALTGKSTNSGAVGDATGGILGGIGKSLGTFFGAPTTQNAEGGDLRAGMATLINERVGRKGEVFIPEVAGRMVPGERASGGGRAIGSSNVYNYTVNAQGAEVGVETRIRAAMVELERSRQSPTAALAGARRKFPLRT